MAKQYKALTVLGWILSALVGVMLAFSATMKLMRSPEMIKGFNETFGYPESVLVPIAIVEISCLVIYLIPQTSVLGAILLTGYLGGAVATHVRVEDAFVPPIVVGAVVWLALFLRDPRVRALVPFRRSLPPASAEPPAPRAVIS